MNYLGIDLHKRNAYCCLLSDSGQVIKSQRVPARRDALREFLRSIPGPTRVALEATRNWYWVFDVIEPEGGKGYTCPPCQDSPYSGDKDKDG